MDITNAEQRFYIKQFESDKLMEEWLTLLLKKWRFISIEHVDGNRVIVKAIARISKLESVAN